MSACRLCGSEELTQFLDLGFTPLADGFLKLEQLNEPEFHYPLSVLRCDSCMFVQLSHVVKPEVLYQQDYPYESSVTRTGRSHFDAFAEHAISSFGFEKNSLAVDVGSNVGVLVSGFMTRGLRGLGIEPADNIAMIAEKNGVPTVNEFFNPQVVSKLLPEHGKAKIITASNVFAHMDDLENVMQAVDIFLDSDGVFIIEAPYLVNMLDKLEYDTIYHEHLSYLSLTPLVPFFKKCGMELFDVLESDIHGGSIRLFVARNGQHEVSKKVRELLELEKAREIHSLDFLFSFATRVSTHRDELVWLLKSLKRDGKRIAGVSAPAKGMTLLNYSKIGSETLDFLTEKSALKIGQYAPGSHLPVRPDQDLITEDIDYALLLAWNFKDEIMANLSEFSDKGGKFIIPIPEPVII